MQPKRPKHLNLLQRALPRGKLIRHIRDIPHKRLELRTTPVRYEFISQRAAVCVVGAFDVLSEEGRRIAPCLKVAFLRRPEDKEALEQGLFWVKVERAEERQILRCGGVWTESARIRTIGERLIKAKTILLCRGCEKVDLAVDVGEGAGKKVDDAPAERGGFIADEGVW